MATKDRRKLQHIHSSIADKQPTPQSLEVGEIAVNNASVSGKSKSFLSIKNSENKIDRFSSDSTIIDWIEKKEVMPYSGVVDNVHLDTNRSNIEIKINQVAAKNTPKYNLINGAVDIDGNLVNPSTDGGKTDGAGIAIDMSRYAMIGANPSFSSITVTHRSNLSGTTNISNGAGGEVLNITTTNVNANGTNWTETITNKKSTVTTEENKIGTLNESATTRTTTVGTESLTVSGTTTETKIGNVVENHSGTTIENKKGDVTENNSANKQENTTGTHKVYTTGDTCVNSQANANFYGKVSTNIGVACDGTNGSATTVYGTTTTISGNTTNVTGATTLNLSGATINEKANTANTNVTSAYTSATTATTIIGTANTSATTATLSGDSLTVNEANTVISSCTKIDLVTNELNLKQCTTGSVNFDFCNGFGVKSNNIKLEQCDTAGTISITAQTQDINGGSLTINESGNTNINVGGALNENVTGATTINRSGTTTEYNRAGYTANTTGDTCIQSTADVNVGGAANTNIGTNCDDSVKANYVNIKASSAITETANTVTISGTNTVNISGATINESGATHNENFTNYDVNAGNDYCLSAATRANFYGKATNIGIDCNGTTIATATTIEGTTVGISGNTTNISGASVNVSGGSITEISSGKTCITAGSDLNIGGDANTNIGYNCAGTGIANNTNIFASTAVTINAPTTNITGDTYLSGNTYFHKTCTGLTNNEIDAAFCEVLSRGAVTIEKNTSPTDPQLATIYTVKQNGAVINTIEVAKDQFLQNAEVVKNTSGEWVIRLTWWIYDPDSGTHTTATTDVNASELVKDLTAVNPSDNGTALNHNVSVNAWYDATSGDMKFSAETTPNMHVGNMYVTSTTSASTVSGTNVNGGTISGTTVKGVTMSGTNITASDAIRANNVSANTISANTFTGAMSKKLTWAAGAFTADTTGYNGSADKTITVPTAISHLATRGKLTITHNGLSDTYDPASDKSMTLPHSALTFSYGNVSAKTGSDSYNTSSAKSITIPTSIDDLKNYNGSCVEIGHNVCVTGTITATQAIYSSDRNLKNNIKDVEYRMVDDAHNVRIKQFNFKSEPENLVVGVIAQEVEEHNLGDFVYTKEDGNKAVDYTSLMMLKIKYLENENEYLKAQMAEMRLRMENLENKINNQ